MSSARRFALVSPNYHPLTCGVGDHSMRLAQDLQRRGFECAIFTHTPAEPNPAAPEVQVTGVSGRTPLLIAEGIRRSIASFSPTDVVLQYTPQMLGAWRLGSPAPVWLAHAARKMGANVVVLAHELFLPWSKRPDVTLGAALMHLQLAAIMRFADRVLVTVERRATEIGWMAKTFGRQGSVGVVRVGPGALPRPRAPQNGRLRLGTFSTLGRDKRFEVLLDCFERVRARRPEAELVILGDLGDRARPHVMQFHDAVLRHPGRDRIRLLGKQPLDDIAREMATLDVYLFPMMTGANTRSSTLPVALGTGLPVVAVKGVETDALFVDGENVLFAERMSGDSFAAAVLALAQPDGLAERISRGALALYNGHLRWDRIGDQLLNEIDGHGSGTPARLST
jgi:glycosyltransferase involved in cell wall biosynthesis